MHAGWRKSMVKNDLMMDRHEMIDSVREEE